MEIQMKKNRKRAVIIGAAALLCLIAALIFAATANSDERKLADQLELGRKYLSEMDYEQAVAAFEAAIAIDPKNADAYLGLADAYIGLGDYDQAVAILEEGYESTGEEAIKERLDELTKELETTEDAAEASSADNRETGTEAARTFYPLRSDLEIPFTVDDIILGETGIEAAKSAYGNRPFALSNLMNDEQDDSVYTCYGMNDMPIPEGYREMEFGFIFLESAGGGGIHDIWINDPDFTCLGALHVWDDGDTALAYFGLQELEDAEDVELEWTLDNGASLSCTKRERDDYIICYELSGNSATVEITDDIIHSVFLVREP